MSQADIVIPVPTPSSTDTPALSPTTTSTIPVFLVSGFALACPVLFATVAIKRYRLLVKKLNGLS